MAKPTNNWSWIRWNISSKDAAGEADVSQHDQNNNPDASAEWTAGDTQVTHKVSSWGTCFGGGRGEEGGGGGSYLVETVADAAELRRKLAG